MMDGLSDCWQDLATLKAHLFDFATTGQRTLVVASREVPDMQSAEWLKRMRHTQSAVSPSTNVLDRLAREIEV